ncbi:DnaJ domain [Musa troglodytarum]|uniref:DnaJ domain n=1 Tax=Musa troglodytarum TaxID=320322 RepID=A0A9E7KJJ6_9LILI|nr:DnaJ domain [Musa troglodytarum]
MDESWRVSIGSILPRRRSTEEARGRRGRWADSGAGDGAPLGPDDFRDVFGGPPRTVLLRRFSGELHAPADPRPVSFYDELFRPAERPRGIPRAAAGRGVPAFGALPRAGLVRTEEGFYDDIFGSEGGGRGRKSRSKSSSSVLSSEDMSPPIRMAASVAEDAVLSSFASKLRYRQSRSHPGGMFLPRRQIPERNGTATGLLAWIHTWILETVRRETTAQASYFDRGLISASPAASPPETISLEASFRRSQDEPTGCDNSDADSPSSVISSVFLDPVLSKADRGVEGHREAAESSYVIEINGHGMGGKEGAAAIDEAIAWAKQKFWDHQMSKGLDEPLQPEDEIKGKENPVGIC